MNYFVCLDIYILTKNKLINLFIYSMLIHRDTVVEGVIKTKQLLITFTFTRRRLVEHVSIMRCFLRRRFNLPSLSLC